MSGPKTVRISTNSSADCRKQGDKMSMSFSPAAEEAFQFLNAGAKKHWRGQGDTWTAARDRASEEAGIKASQGERLQKNWRTMKFPNADVYRLLRNTYGHLCQSVENTADRIDQEAQEIEETHEATQGAYAPMACVEAPPQRKERQVT